MSSTDQPVSASVDAVDMLVADHAKVKGLFDEYADLAESGADVGDRQALVKEIVTELKTHEGLENNVFFPAVKDVLKKEDVLGVAAEEQIDAGEVITELSELKGSEPDFDQKVMSMGQLITEHAEEEEAVVFPQVTASSVDTEKLGVEMASLKSSIFSHDEHARTEPLADSPADKS
jgi:hemerythrin superfamily protein